jgi:hypothetical protein
LFSLKIFSFLSFEDASACSFWNFSAPLIQPAGHCQSIMAFLDLLGAVDKKNIPSKYNYTLSKATQLSTNVLGRCDAGEHKKSEVYHRSITYAPA